MPSSPIAIPWLLVFGSGVQNLPVGLLAAVRSAISADATFAQTFPGGAYFGQAPENSPTPYVVFHEITSVPVWLTGPGYYENESCSASIWTTDNSNLKSVGIYLEKWLQRRNFARDDGTTVTIQRTNSRQSMSNDRAQNNTIKYSYSVDFYACTSKTM